MVEVALTNDTPDYVVNARWVLEGILLPGIGGLGIVGMVWVSYQGKYQGQIGRRSIFNLIKKNCYF